MLVNRNVIRILKQSSNIRVRHLPYDRSTRKPVPSVEIDPSTGERLLPAYAIDKSTQILEAERQACFLTKTIARPGVPPNIADAVLTDEHRLSLMSSFEACIMDTTWFHIDRELVFDMRNVAAIRDHLSSRIILNMQRALWSHPMTDMKKLLDTNVTPSPHVMASWERLGNRFQVVGRLGHLICGREPLPLFANQEEIEATRKEEVLWDDIISPLFDMHKCLVRFQNESAFLGDVPFPFPQTIFYAAPFREAWYPKHATGQAVFFCFATAMTHALEHGAQMGEELRTPVPVQAVVFSGSDFYFVCFQLNTLNFDDGADSVKNMAWIESGQKLYHRVCAAEDILEEAEKPLIERRIGHSDVLLEGFNEYTAELFVKFMYHPMPVGC